MADPVVTVADRLEPALRRALARAFARLTGLVSLEDLARAVQTGRVGPGLARALDALPRLVAAEVRPVVDRAVAAGAKASTEAAGRLRVRGTLSVPASAFRQVNARAVERAASQATASLVRSVTAGTRQAIRRAVTRAVSGEEGAASRKAVSRALRGVVGLDPRRANAVTNYLASERARGTDPETAARRAGAYAEKLQRQRQRTIARTEILRASNEGRLAHWRDMQAKGYLAEDAVRVWVVGRDDRLCDECEAMDGAEAALDEPFDGGVDGPPLHPNCRCTVVLKKPER